MRTPIFETSDFYSFAGSVYISSPLVEGDFSEDVREKLTALTRKVAPNMEPEELEHLVNAVSESASEMITRTIAFPLVLFGRLFIFFDQDAFPNHSVRTLLPEGGKATCKPLRLRLDTGGRYLELAHKAKLIKSDFDPVKYVYLKNYQPKVN
ncbi:hypothetical protein [Neptuniibacter sp. QD37_11]|uniref:hypothetical protein n=1 Tax=Neptuniibacter sp. QD37_11 TaxID=3398209 RepID=UPI0039F46AEC